MFGARPFAYSRVVRRSRLSVVVLAFWALLCLVICAGWLQSYWVSRSVSYETKGLRFHGATAESSGGSLSFWWVSSAHDFPARGLRYTCVPTTQDTRVPAWPWRLIGRGLPTVSISGSGVPDPAHWQIQVTVPWLLPAVLIIVPMLLIRLRRRVRRPAAGPVVWGRARRYLSRVSAALAVIVLALGALSFVQRFDGQWAWQRGEGPSRDQVRKDFVQAILQRGALGLCIDHPRYSAAAVGIGTVQDNWHIFWNWDRPGQDWYWKGEEGMVLGMLGFGLEHRGPTAIAGVIPLWPLAIIFLILPVSQFRRRRLLLHRVRHGLCMHCGYDLRASKERCPECGTAIAADPATRCELKAV